MIVKPWVELLSIKLKEFQKVSNYNETLVINNKISSFIYNDENVKVKVEKNENKELSAANYYGMDIEKSNHSNNHNNNEDRVKEEKSLSKSNAKKEEYKHKIKTENNNRGVYKKIDFLEIN